MTYDEAVDAIQVAFMDTGRDAERVVHTLEDCQECKRLARLALNAIGWKPISLPGSGLDGLLTDINRDQ